MEHFKNFIEIQALLKKISTHEENIQEHQNRINFVESSREKRNESRELLISKREELIKESQSLENSLFDKEKDLTRANENSHKASNQAQATALENEIQKLEPIIDQIQENILTILEVVESLDTEIKEADEFLKGSLETLNELKEEVRIDIDKEQQEIKNYSDRMNLLLESLENTQRKFFEQTLKNIKDKQVISFLNGKLCSRCRYEASSTQITEIENGRSIEVCDNCSRILIPSTINSF